MTRFASPSVNAARAADLLVVGGGIFGLWAATRAVEAGFRVTIVDAEAVGAGASATYLGALTAHAPDRWNEKKQFQLEALATLPGEIARLEADTGLGAGYGRVGRVMPIRNENFFAQAQARAEGAARWWAPVDAAFRYEPARRTSEPMWCDAWLSAEAAPVGVVADTLAARLEPRLYTTALAARLRAQGAELVEGARYLGWRDGAAEFEDGTRRPAAAVVIAAGWRAFDLLAGTTGARIGGGVKGQAVLARPSAPPPPHAPLIYEDGVYVIAHENGSVAVGATSEKEWRDPDRPDPSNDAFWRRAQQLCPALRDAEILSWWAGVRPKCRLRDPMLGRLPGAAPLFAMVGGFKISFGIAHEAATRLVAEIAGDSSAATRMPDRFRVAAHLDAAAAHNF